MPSQALREIVYRLIEEATGCDDIDRKRALAERSFTLAQEAELATLARTKGSEIWRIYLRRRNILRYRRMLAAGIADETERQIFERLLRDAEFRR